MLRGLKLFVPAAVAILAAAQPAIGQDDAELTVLTQFAEFGEPLYPPDFTHFDYVNPEAPRGGSIRLAAFGSFDTLNPIPQQGQWPGSIGLASATLMTGSADELFAYYPEIAESVAVPDDLSYAIFTINPEAVWEDGTPIVADDFVYAYDAIMEHGRPLLRTFWAEITSAEALDDRRIRFDFSTTNRWKTVGLAASMGPMPRWYWEAEGRDIGAATLEPPPSEGPYRIARVDPGRSITYERVEDYWAEDLPVNVGQNNFDTITYNYYRDDTVAFEAFKAGEYDYRVENEARRWAQRYDIPEVSSGRIVLDTDPILTPYGFRGFFFNTRRPQFADIRVREGISYLYDFEWQRENLFFGQYRRARSYFPNSEYGVSDLGPPEGRELELLEPFRDQLPERLFADAFEPSETDGSGRIRAQLRQALDLFREAGWEIQGGRLTNVETGRPMRIEFLLPGTATLERIVQPFVRNLERAGIEASIRNVDSAQYFRQLDDYDFDMIYQGLNFFPPPGTEQRTFWSSEAADTRGTGNLPGIRSPVVDAMIETIAEAETLDEIIAGNRGLDRTLLWGFYGIPSYYADENRFAYWNRFGRPDQTPRYAIGTVSTWWVDPELDTALVR